MTQNDKLGQAAVQTYGDLDSKDPTDSQYLEMVREEAQFVCKVLQSKFQEISLPKEERPQKTKPSIKPDVNVHTKTEKKVSVERREEQEEIVADRTSEYLIFNMVGSVIPIEKHPLPSVFMEQTDFIVSKGDI